MIAALWLTLLANAAALVLQKRGPAEVIGFRTLDPEQAARYQRAGTITWTSEDANRRSSDQLGAGAYLSPTMGDWAGPASGWYCAILADSTAWNNVKKAWVPQATADECPKPLWYSPGVPNRPGYLTSVGDSSYTTANTVLFSPIQGYETAPLGPLYQWLIPPDLLINNPLSIVVQCAAKADVGAWTALAAAYGTVDWMNFPGLLALPQGLPRR